jgi:hypothetical protein
VKANHAANPPSRPLPRRNAEREADLAGSRPGKNWQSATTSAKLLSLSHFRRSTNSALK